MGKLNKTNFKDFKNIVDEYFKGNQTDKESEEDSVKLEDSELDEFETFPELIQEWVIVPSQLTTSTLNLLPNPPIFALEASVQELNANKVIATIIIFFIFI